MELKQYYAMLRRWAWLLVTGAALGALVGLVASALQTPMYQASTRIIVLRAPQEQSNEYTYLSDQQLVQTYMQLLETQPVLEKTAQRINAPVRDNLISVSQEGETQTIRLTVEDAAPERASAIANTLVQVLIEQNEIIQAGRYTLTEQSLQAQIAQVEAQINAMSSELENVSAEKVIEQQKQVEAQIAVLQNEAAQLQSEIATLKTIPEQQALLIEKEARLNQTLPVLELYQQIYTDLVVLGKPVTAEGDNSRLSQLQTALQLYQQIYINLLNNLESIRLAKLQNTPNVVQIEAAATPAKPIRPRPLNNISVAATIGLTLAAGIAFLFEYTDDTIRSPEDVERILQAPVIGYIGDMELAEGESADAHVFYHPRSPIAEAFRTLRTNLEYSNVDETLQTMLITSADMGEGKTTVAVNLAVIIAQSGKRVLLMDADMRRPRIHHIFGAPNHLGLSSLFRKNIPAHTAIRPVEGIKNLFIMTSGSLPPNPAELLASAKMEYVLEECRQIADIIIIDSPPSLVTDYQVISTKADGALLIVQLGETHAESAYAMLEQLRRVNARVLGVALNRITRGSRYGGYYHYEYGKNSYYGKAENVPALALPAAPENCMEFYVPQPEYEAEKFNRPAQAREKSLAEGRAQLAGFAPEFDQNLSSGYIIQKDNLEYAYYVPEGE